MKMGIHHILLFLAFVVCTSAAMKSLWVDPIMVINDEDCKARSKPGDILHMEYTGKLEDGTVFDSSITRNQLYVFELGAGNVIRGWDEGLVNMCVYEQRYLIIPPEYAYGEAGDGDVIPGGSTLYMNVSLMKLERKGDLERQEGL